MSRIVENAIYKSSEKYRKRILELMDEYDLLTNQSFADYFGISAPVIRKATEYGTFPALRILIKMADKLECSLLYLMGETDKNDFVKAQNPSTFFERFPELAGKKKYGSIAAKLTFPRMYIYDWMKNKRLPSLDFLMELSAYFNVSPDYLLGRTDDRD